MRARRLVWAFLIAAAIAAATTHWTPACALYPRYSFEWYALGCWFGEPDPPYPPEA